MMAMAETGRIINVLYLIEQNLLTLPILYLSRYIVKNKTSYYTLLNQVTSEAHWENWVLFMLKGVEQTSNWTCHKIIAVKELMDFAKTVYKSRATQDIQL